MKFEKILSMLIDYKYNSSLMMYFKVEDKFQH